MEIVAFISVIFSALLHATWNIAGKKVADNIAVPALAFFSVGLLLSPYLLISIPSLQEWKNVLFWSLLSGLIHVIYIICLFHAYRKWDVTIIYPIVRSSGVLICALASLYFFKDQFNNIGLLGVSCIIIGILIKGLCRHLAQNSQSNMAITIASGIGCLVGSYLVIDRIAIEFVDPLSYAILLNLATGLLFIPYLYMTKPSLIINAIHQSKRYIAIIGSCNLFSYLIILWVFTQTKFGYVTSLREISIVFSVVLGLFFLNERLTKIQTLGISFLLIGAFLIKNGS